MNHYFVKTRGHVAQFDVDKTQDRYIKSACFWTKEKMQAALAELDSRHGVSDLRIVEFQPVGAHHNAFDLDQALGI